MKKTETIAGLLLSLIIVPIFLFWLGASHVVPLFDGEFTQHLGSIEVSYITMAKFISSSWPRLLWQPLWYMGYPMSVLYTPFVPFFEFLTNNLFAWSYAHSYRVLTAFAYAGGLVTLFFFVRSLFKNTIAGIVSAMSYALLPSIIAILYSEVAQDVFSLNFIDPRRFTILVRWGEGPHVVSLLFLPLAALGLLNFLRKGNKWWLATGSFFSVLTVLTNSIGAWGLAILGFCVIVGVAVENTKEQNHHTWMTTFWRTLLFGSVSYGLVAFWFNPLFLSTFFREGGGTASYWKNQFPWGWLILIGVLIVYILVSKKLLVKISGATTAFLFFGIMFWFVNTYYASGSEKIEMVPQVLRLNTEVDIGVGLLIGLIVGAIGTFTQKKKQMYYGVMGGLFMLSLIFFVPRQLAILSELPSFTRSAEKMGIDLTKTPEYEVAKTLESKVNGQERVLAPGNYAFYLNYFTDIPQLRGALFQSAIHPWAEHIYYQMANGKDADISLDWLKIANVGWLVYGGPRELYRDFKVPATKFDEVLTLDEEKNADRYYKVPLKSASLAKAVPKEIIDVPIPKNAIDKEPIKSYVSLLETSDHALEIKGEKNGQYHISGELGEGEVVLVQMAYVSGWKAKLEDGKYAKVTEDPLGFILISPEKVGTISLDLIYQVPIQVRFGQIVTVLTLLGTTYLLLKGKRNLLVPKPSKKAEENKIIDKEE